VNRAKDELYVEPYKERDVPDGKWFWKLTTEDI
jgi:hypothetical protein